MAGGEPVVDDSEAALNDVVAAVPVAVCVGVCVSPASATGVPVDSSGATTGETCSVHRVPSQYRTHPSPCGYQPAGAAPVAGVEWSMSVSPGDKAEAVSRLTNYGEQDEKEVPNDPARSIATADTPGRLTGDPISG